MSKPITEKSPKPLTAGEVVQALNYHGAFLKKHVLATLRGTPGIRGVTEEYPSEFGGKTRTADILAKDDNNVVYVIECKKVSPEKSWIFIKGIDQFYRVARRYTSLGASSTFAQSTPPESPVCSEGYEYRRSSANTAELLGKADQFPIFEAGGQLASAFLGFVHDRVEQLKESPRDRTSTEYYVPVLVTNARLFFINADQLQLDTETGEVTTAPDLSEVPHVILKQPAASPKNFPDFRTSIVTEERNQRFHESIYVINAKSLGAFFSIDHRDFLAAAGD